MKIQQFYTIGQAADATGKAKSTIKKAIDDGDLSVAEKTKRGFKIDASELDRVFPFLNSERSGERSEKQNETVEKTNSNSGLQVEVKMLREMIDNLNAEREKDREEAAEQIGYLREKLEKAENVHREQQLRLEDQREQIGTLLPSPEPQLKRKTFFGFEYGQPVKVAG